MVNFDSSAPGTSEQVWRADPRLHTRPALNFTQADELIVVAAHPDDETLGAAGLIAHCAQLGIPVRIFCVTDGAGSHPGNPQITQTRAREFTAAVHSLAPNATTELLGFPDGQTRELRTEIRARLASVFAAASANAVVAVTWRGDGHRDHRVVGEIVAELAGSRVLLEYPIWMWHWAHPADATVPWDRMTSLDIDATAKATALHQYASQTVGDLPVLREDFIAHSQREWELFITSNQGLGQDYFDALYAKSPDPWRFRTRWYEQRKRDITVASLPLKQYGRVLEIGCSIGLLTDLLATRSRELLAIDLSFDAVEQAKKQVETRATIRRQDALEDFPTGKFDLVVLSEVGYYWTVDNLNTVLAHIARSLNPGGTVLACHWRHPVADYPLSGDAVHEAINKQGWARLVHHIEDDFTLEVLSTDARSVAQQEGLL